MDSPAGGLTTPFEGTGGELLRFPRDILYKKVKTGIYPSGTFNIPMTLRPNPRDVEQAAGILLDGIKEGYAVAPW